MISRDQSGPDRIEHLGPGDDAKVEQASALFDINRSRSRGDKDEPFGERGASWKGAFVGGEHLVHAVTQGLPGEQLYGNFPAYQRYPPA
jgi:hypothetical protein